MPPSVIVSGAIANKPDNGGNAWTRLCWINGLRQLGFDVTFVEQIADLPWRDRAIAYFQQVAPAGRSALVTEDGRVLAGLPADEVRRRAGNAVLLVNISGHLTVPELKQVPACRVYFDDDPGFTQFWHAQGDSAPRLDGHDFYYTLGGNIGRADCPIPTGAIRWRPIFPPVFLPDWPVQAPAPFAGFTTVASWRGPYAPLRVGERTYGQKVHEFRKFIDLPARTGLPFELALEIHPGDDRDAKALRAHGWGLIPSAEVAATPDPYRAYVQRSSAEFSAAQGLYVETNSGWFSDRTARYLASGRPALVQETGFSRRLPQGEGLIAFRTPDEAVDGACRIARDYAQHARAARRIALDHFDATRILQQLLQDVGVS